MAAIDELKVEALKLVMTYESTLTENEKNLIGLSLKRFSRKSFEDFIRDDLVDPISKTQDKIRV